MDRNDAYVKSLYRGHCDIYLANFINLTDDSKRNARRISKETNYFAIGGIGSMHANTGQACTCHIKRRKNKREGR